MCIPKYAGGTGTVGVCPKACTTANTASAISVDGSAPPARPGTRDNSYRLRHAEHVPEVGTCTHPDVLKDVREDLPALDHPPFQHHEVLLKQDQVRRLLGDVSGGVHRDADVRCSQGGSVVDSVAHESDDVPLAAEGTDDSL